MEPRLENTSTRLFDDTAQPLALRGDRFALVRTTLPAGEGAAPVLVLCEVDEDGRALEGVTFDLADKADAIRSLERRYLASPSSPPIAHAVAGWTEAFNTRDWDGFRVVLAEDLIVRDRRPIAIGDRNNRAELIASVQVGVELVPDMFVFVIRDYALADHVACGLLRVEGRTADGGPMEWEYVAVTAMRPDGQIHLFEEFNVEDTADALARFEELARS